MEREAQGGPREAKGRPEGAQGKDQGGGTMKNGGEGTGASGSNVTSVCLIIAAVM